MVTDDTVAVNWALLDPAATVTLAGTVTLALLSESVTANPPAGAAPLSVTVHAEVPGAFTLAGVQVKPLTVCRAFRFTVTSRLALAVPTRGHGRRLVAAYGPRRRGERPAARTPC